MLHMLMLAVGLRVAARVGWRLLAPAAAAAQRRPIAATAQCRRQQQVATLAVQATPSVFCIVGMAFCPKFIMIYMFTRCLHENLLNCLQGCEYGLRVASRMERYSDQYTLIISSANKWLDR
jgi:hypothetical protein